MRALLLSALVFAIGSGCAIRVEPIHITVDINIKVDRALDEFFATPAKSAPAAPTATPTK
jgi:hypothetical protein